MRKNVNLLEEVVQRAGFEPANRYGLGPHPSAFDQAGRLLRRPSLLTRVYQHRDPEASIRLGSDSLVYLETSFAVP